MSEEEKDQLKNDSTEEEMTPEQVAKILNFANAITANFPGWGAWTPQTINAQMQNISYNPILATQAELDQAMLNPRANEKQIRGIAESYPHTSMPFRRILDYLGNMLAFDYTYTSDTEDYNSKVYKKDVKEVTNFFTKFKVKQQFTSVVKQILKEEAAFYVLRDDGTKYVLQMLPADRCLITGRFSGGFLFDFDMAWFLNPSNDINMYPPIFKKMFQNTFHMDIDTARTKYGQDFVFYNPHTPIEDRSNNTFSTWCSTSPEDNFWAFKMTPEIASILPYFLPLFQDIILQPLIRNLTKNNFIASASKILFGEVPMLNKDAKAKVSDMLALSPQDMNLFMTLVKQAINSEVVKVAAAPLNNVAAYSFPLTPSDASMYSTYLKSALASSGINTSLIFTSDVKANVQESLLSLAVDEQLVESLYPQFNDFLEYYINKRTKNHFEFEFEGSNFYTDKQNRWSIQKDFLTMGICLPQKVGASVGIEPHKFFRMMAEAKTTGFTDMLTPIQTAFTMGKGGSSDGGRPQKDASQLSDAGDSSRGNQDSMNRAM